MGDYEMPITICDAINALNDMVKTDRATIKNLLSIRIECNEALADHPTVQVMADNHKYRVGLLGIINGIFGANDEGIGFIAAEYDDEGKLMGFIPTPIKKEGK